MKLHHPLLGRLSPVATPVRTGGATGKVGSFGWTRFDGDGKRKMHKGIDLLADVGWPVFAAHSGTVVKSGWENYDNHGQGFGQRVWIEAKDGSVKTVYAHLSTVVALLGDVVRAGDLVGLVGRTGNVGHDLKIPTHLHFEAHVENEPVDPVTVL